MKPTAEYWIDEYKKLSKHDHVDLLHLEYFDGVWIFWAEFADGYDRGGNARTFGQSVAKLRKIVLEEKNGD